MAAKGVFVTVEGMDGSGKTTVCRHLYEHYAKNYPGRVVLTREPGGNGLPVCEMIRELLLGSREARMAPSTEALLFAASRAEHVDKLIAPALRQGQLVISDRYIDSSIAYQGVGRGLGEEWVRRINGLAVHDVMPQLTLLLVMRPDDAARRVSERSVASANHLDLLPEQFHDAINRHFLKMAHAEPERFVTVDAGSSEKKVLAQAVAAIDALLAKTAWSE